MESAENIVGAAVSLRQRFHADDLPQVRRLTAKWAAGVGLPPPQVTDFMLAVHEVAVNAVLHGSPVAELLLRLGSGGEAEAEIRDRGHWVPSGQAVAAPGTGMGMGLRVARQVCDGVDIRTGPGGTVVMLRMRLP